MKTSVSYTYAYELVPPSNIKSVNGAINTVNFLTLFVIGFYYYCISKSWFPLYLVVTLLYTFAYLIVIFVLPESPKWLLATDRPIEAIHALNWIAKVNRKKEPFAADELEAFMEHTN